LAYNLRLSLVALLLSSEREWLAAERFVIFFNVGSFSTGMPGARKKWKKLPSRMGKIFFFRFREHRPNSFMQVSGKYAITKRQAYPMNRFAHHQSNTLMYCVLSIDVGIYLIRKKFSKHLQRRLNLMFTLRQQ
jgi:hypothetical protein